MAENTGSIMESWKCKYLWVSIQSTEVSKQQVD